MEENKDFDKLMNRIAITVVIGLFFIVGLTYFKNNPPKVSFIPDEVKVYDTIQVMSNEGLTHEVIIGYHIKVNKSDMSEMNKELYYQNQREYFNRKLFLPVEDRLRTVVSHEIRFENLDSILVVCKKFKDVVGENIRDIAFSQPTELNGIVVKSIEGHYKFNSVLSKYIKPVPKQYP
jgi:hypothetical protein